MEKKNGGLKNILDGFKGLFITKASPGAVEQSPDQKRKLTRIRCEYRVVCMADGKTFAGMVVDMGLGGMRLKLTRTVKPGTALAVTYDTDAGYSASRRYTVETVNTQVVWCHKKPGTSNIEAAVTYSDAEDVMSKSWVKFILRQLGFESHGIKERRKDVRVKAGISAEIKAEDNAQAEGTEGVIANLGAGGCLFESRTTVRQLSRLQMRIGSIGDLRPFSCVGTVITVQKVPDMPRWQLGIRFEGLRSEDVRLLGRYISFLLKRTLAEESRREG